MIDLQLELFEKDWVMYVPAGGSMSLLEGMCGFVKGGMSPGFLVLKFQKSTVDLVFLSSAWDQDISSQPLLRCHACLLSHSLL